MNSNDATTVKPMARPYATCFLSIPAFSSSQNVFHSIRAKYTRLIRPVMASRTATDFDIFIVFARNFSVSIFVSKG